MKERKYADFTPCGAQRGSLGMCRQIILWPGVEEDHQNPLAKRHAHTNTNTKQNTNTNTRNTNTVAGAEEDHQNPLT